ncbi:hypothetical protein H2200_003726 [Cladophialophora chaetospira]|uniref:Uncharacterized protein n=1 Tax=Cladophialophora chaetospira TaxID=386627 RepID=A0AA38XFJ2_9EURO|nr:hypothetical protein H2200_003726 [Cladophialophora chaetospira]
MSKREQSDALLFSEEKGAGITEKPDNAISHLPAHGQGEDFSMNTSSALPDFKAVTMPPVSTDPHQSLLVPEKDKALGPAVSIHTLDSQNTSLKSNATVAVGQPARKRKFSIRDSVAVFTSLFCLLLGVIIISPHLTLSWHLGFQNQIIVIGFLIGVMNLCAVRVVPSCFLAIEAKFGKSRLQNYEALLTNKFLSSHVGWYWRVIMILFLAIPLALSVGYKQFLGGTTTAGLKPLSGLYGVSYPIIGDWTPINDPIYLQISSNAAYHTGSANDTPILNGSNHYPLAYGYNVLLLSNDSAALLDLPTNEYLQTIRSKFKDGETWQISASVNAYVATRNASAAEHLRTDDTYWESALNASSKGLVSYWLARDANTYIGMLPTVNEPFCWMGVYQGGLTTDDMYSKSLSDLNVYGFRTTAELFSLRRQRCQATWQVSASGMRLLSGICDNSPQAQDDISQEAVTGTAAGVWSVAPAPSLPHIFWRFVDSPNSPWLMPTYAVTTATAYWARGVYMIDANNIPGYNYTGGDERILSSRRTLDAVPGLFLCLVVLPVITIAAFLTKAAIAVPLGGGFGLIAVLAGIKRSTLDVLGGAGFSGELKRPVRLDVSVGEKRVQEVGGRSVATVSYELRAEGKEGSALPRTHGSVVYL